MTGIELRDFSVSYPGFRLGPLSLSLDPGERIALVGPNGAGKSTLLRAVVGRIPDHDGRVVVGGDDVARSLPGIRREIGFLPERLKGFGGMSVGEHLELLSAFYPRWDAGYARELLERLRLEADKKLGDLSEGMKVKLSFVAAEAHRPPFLLLDEPTSGLDPMIRRELLDLLLERLEASPGRLLLFSTHILEDVGVVGDRVLVLQDGGLEADTSVDELREEGGTVGEAVLGLLSGDAEREFRSARLP